MNISTLNPISAPTPTAPSPWYFIEEITLITPDGASVAWAIGVEDSDNEFLTKEDDPHEPWLAKDKACAISHVKYLNGMTAEFPTCTCHD